MILELLSGDADDYYNQVNDDDDGDDDGDDLVINIEKKILFVKVQV
jgi:hypothetical protein